GLAQGGRRGGASQTGTHDDDRELAPVRWVHQSCGEAALVPALRDRPVRGLLVADRSALGVKLGHLAHQPKENGERGNEEPDRDGHGDGSRNGVDGTLTPRLVLTEDRKSTRLNSSHVKISYAVFCLKKKIK